MGYDYLYENCGHFASQLFNTFAANKKYNYATVENYNNLNIESISKLFGVIRITCPHSKKHEIMNKINFLCKLQTFLSLDLIKMNKSL